MRVSRHHQLGAIVCVAALACSAQAQWTAVTLHPAGHVQSRINSGSGGVFGGMLVEVDNGPGIPVYWDAATLSRTTLPVPPGAVTGAQVFGASPDAQVGWALGHAMLWNGPSTTPADLHPAGALESRGLAVANGVQVGWAAINANERAAHWTGSAASFIDLTPPGSARAVINATNGQQHAGWTEIGIATHAALWTGSSGAWTDLNPPGALNSQLLGMDQTQQVGWARVTTPQGNRDHAGYWSGTAASWIDLHPGTNGSSMAFATNGAAQVGAFVNATTVVSHAAIWFGSAGSVVDLHSFLPPGYDASVAYSVTEVNGQIIVGGIANRDFFGGGPIEAYVWVLVPSPGTAAILGLGALAALRRRRA